MKNKTQYKHTSLDSSLSYLTFNYQIPLHIKVHVKILLGHLKELILCIYIYERFAQEGALCLWNYKMAWKRFK